MITSCYFTATYHRWFTIIYHLQAMSLKQTPVSKERRSQINAEVHDAIEVKNAVALNISFTVPCLGVSSASRCAGYLPGDANISS